MSDAEARVFAAFQVEYPEHLQHIRAVLASPTPDWQKALRHAHNLKGAARAVDLFAVEKLAHRMETVFARAGKSELAVNPEVQHVLHQVLDGIEDWIVTFSAGRSPTEPTDALAAIDRLLTNEETPAPAPRPVPEAPEVSAEETMRIATSRVERLLGSAGQVVSEGLRQDVLLREVTRLKATVDDLAREWKRQRRSAPHADRLDAHVQGLARQARRVHRLQVESQFALQRQGRRLTDDVRRILLVPARSVFEGFPKLMRDLSRDLGKAIEFDMQGVDVQADRRVLQALKDPIVHLLRNAASHGIEPAAERVSTGKSPTGHVTLRLVPRGSRLVVRIEDDGRGIDFHRVLQIAVKRGLLNEAEAVAATPSDLGRLLFAPGFSTSQVITEVSGRGIGLSVVHEAMSLLRGEVQTEAMETGGTAFVLSVPLSLSMQTLLLVPCRGQTFGLPTSGIERLYRMRSHQLHTVEGRPVLETPHGPIPLWSLAHLLFRDLSSPPRHNDFLSIAVVKSGVRRVAVGVEAFSGKVDGMLQSLGPVPPVGARVAGGIILGDGAVCLVLNPLDLIELARDAPQTPLASTDPTPAPMTEKEPPCVLVVDDSFTTRTLEKGILESSGYRVRVAVDGLEALQAVRSEPVDLIVADVQMPHMDGFELLAALKADPLLARIPVILVTSLEKREDQERGLSLGADAYIVKRRFEQRDLLETVRQLI